MAKVKNIKKQKRTGKPAGREDLRTPEFCARVRKMAEQGTSTAAIARLEGCAEITVARAILDGPVVNRTLQRAMAKARAK